MQAREERQRAQRAAAAQRTADQLQRDEERRRRATDEARTREIADLSRETAALREELAAKPWAQAPERITVLFVAASPQDQDPLRIDREVREIQQRLRASEYRDAVQFEYRLATQLKDLLQALNEVRPHVVHFSGHGDQDVLVFEDDDGQARELTNSDLAQLLHVSSERIRLAVFNSCRSSDQAELACDHVDVAIGMSTTIDDDAARIFSAQLYNAIGFGKSIETAYDQAKLQVRLELGSDSGDARLFTRAALTPTEIYLVKPPPPD